MHQNEKEKTKKGVKVQERAVYHTQVNGCFLFARNWTVIKVKKTKKAIESFNDDWN